MNTSALGPMLLLIGAVILAICFIYWKRTRPNRYHRRMQRQSKRAYERLKALPPGAVINYLRKMNPHAVEEIVLDAAARAGHPIRRNKSYVGDGGVDGQIQIDGVWHLVQTKRYGKTINPQHVRDFSALCAQRGQPGLFVHCGRTGDKSKANASSAVRFVSGQRIVDLINGQSLSQSAA